MKNLYTLLITKIFDANPILRTRLLTEAAALAVGLLLISDIAMAGMDGNALWAAIQGVFFGGRVWWRLCGLG